MHKRRWPNGSLPYNAKESVRPAKRCIKDTIVCYDRWHFLKLVYLLSISVPSNKYNSFPAPKFVSEKDFE